MDKIYSVFRYDASLILSILKLGVRIPSISGGEESLYLKGWITRDTTIASVQSRNEVSLNKFNLRYAALRKGSDTIRYRFSLILGLFREVVEIKGAGYF